MSDKKTQKVATVVVYTKSSMGTALQLDKLTKVYGHAKQPAIKDVSLTLQAGEVYGFLGSNGAGKSTTIRTILGFIFPTSGTATILGKDSVKDAVITKRDIGYLAGDVILPKRVTGRKLLRYLSNLSGGVDQAYLDMLVGRFEAQLDKRTDTLSKGNRQKIGLIQAFMHQPKVIILDEPTSGLDPVMQERFYQTVAEAKERGAAVFLSSHNFAEVERICDQVAIIKNGSIVHESPVAKMMERRLPSWRIVLAKKADAAKLKKNASLTIVSADGDSLLVRPSSAISPALAALGTVEVISMGIEQDELEGEFMSFYNGDRETK